MIKKNTAYTGFGIGHFINTTTGAAVTTGTPTCKRTIDGTGGACANAASYNSDGAVWEIDLADTDTNGAVIVLSFTLTDCLPISYTLFTDTKIVSDLNDFDGTNATLHSDYDAAKSAYTGTPPTATQIVDEWETQANADPTGFKVNVVEWNGETTPVDNMESAFDGDGYGFTNCTMPTVTTLTNKTGFSLVSTGLDLVTAWTTDITGTVSGNSTHDADDVVTALGTGSTLTDCATATGFSTHDAAAVVTALETDGTKLDHLWEMTEDDEGVRRLTANALEEAPSGTGASASEIVTAMEANGTKLDHLWETTEDDGGVRRFTENSLEQAPSGTGASAVAIREEMDENSTQLAILVSRQGNFIL